ncbi:MAG: hypothetical protein KKC46_07455 [Proteobacteria bacterium]|nr:hypothetical protein [Pseudomonadota bacterium]
MSKEFQIERHKKLLEEKTRQAKRVVFGGLLFGIFILVNVLAPYINDLKEINKVELEIKKYNSEIWEIEKTLQPLNELSKILDNIQKLVAKRPWDVETKKLINKFREMNVRGGVNWNDYQAEADATINSVAAIVNYGAIEPLNKFLLNSPSSKNLIPELVAELKTLPETVDTWVSENKGKRWYLTIEMKTAQIERLSNTLGNKLRLISRTINREKPNLAKRQKNIEASIEKLRNNPEYRNKEERLEKLRSQMEKILPAWLKGMISIEQMVQIFPFIIVILTAYVLIIASGIASHYRFLARELNFGEEGYSDPSFSSLWTLIYRGRFGTLVTVSVYIIFILIMWFFFESGREILAGWLEIEKAWFINTVNLSVIVWLSRMLLALFIAYTAIYPYYQKGKSDAVHTALEKK